MHMQGETTKRSDSVRQAGRWRRVVAIALALGALGATSVAANASAATAPATFYGVVPQTGLDGTDFERMGKGKVGTLRIVITWAAIDTTSAADDSDWSTIDPLVFEAAENGVEILPFIYGTPKWVAKGLDHSKCKGAKCGIYAPKSKAGLAAWKTFVGEVVARYGPGGEFWALHPEVPEKPIHAYQLWNEQNSESFYAPEPDPKAYTKLLAAGAEAIRAGDPAAQVVLGGMAELAGSHKAIRGSEYLAELYKVGGASKSFDGVAPHPYGATVGKVSSQIDLYRSVMKHAHDSGASMWVTEIGAGSANGGNSLNRGPAGQASLLTQIYKYFLKQRTKLHVETVDWFSWQDSSQSICSWCASSGLLTKTGTTKPSWKALVKLTGGVTD
jgi:polysaccharide biosynthesis protein PslG